MCKVRCSAPVLFALPLLLLVVLLLQLALYACHTGDNQRWELLEDGSLRLFGTNACMDVRSAGTSKSLEPCFSCHRLLATVTHKEFALLCLEAFPD